MINTKNSSIRSKIIEMSKTWKGVSDIHKQTLNALIGEFSKSYYTDEGNNRIDVKCIYGGTERVVSRINAEDNIILPIISVVPKANKYTENRGRYSPTLIHSKYWDDKKQRAVRLVSLAPKPVDFFFEINVWGRYVSDINQLSEQIRRKFNPSMLLVTELHEDTKSFIDSEENSYQTVLGDSDPRVMLKKIILRIESYVPNPVFKVTSTGKIEEINGQIELRK
mgnify:CR=1 FL=1|tara:strand:- start:6219 stop:6887 length:669 start_codon:yes stop_codon:yes gene_type:complete